MTVEDSMLSSDEDVLHVSAPTDRRPDFCAEALSPRFRMGLLVLTLLGIVALTIAVIAMAVWPAGLLAAGELLGVLFIGALLAVTFLVFMVFGALIGNNPHLHHQGRVMWYVFAALAGPVALPMYWVIHVWPAPFEPEAAPV